VMNRWSLAYCVCLVVSVAAGADARLWTDDSGRYTLEANLLGFNETCVVLQRADHDLVSFPIAQLSAADREYLKSKEAEEQSRRSIDGLQTWALEGGGKLVGRVVDFAQGELSIQRRRGRIYVNDRPLANLPEFYQQLLPKVVAHFENLPEGTRESLEAWLARQRGQRRTFALKGIVLETENGDEYSVPFFLFTDAEQKLLQSGYADWAAARSGADFTSQEERAFRLRSLAAARQRDRQVQREIAELQLQLQAVQAGLTSLWEVTLFPAGGRGRPIWVVMPGRNSRDATAAALQRNPGFVAGPVRRVAG
jgi:hypothetical protein